MMMLILMVNDDAVNYDDDEHRMRRNCFILSAVVCGVVYVFCLRRCVCYDCLYY